MKKNKIGSFLILTILVTFFNFNLAYSQTTNFNSDDSEKNILMVFDASGSMNEQFGGVSRMSALKTAADNFLTSLESSIFVGLRTLAQVKNEDKIEACKMTSLVQPFTKDYTAIKAPIALLNPVGSYTPLAYALTKAENDFKIGNDNVLILLTDGKDTCGGDPAKVASDLYNSAKKIKIYVIGMGIDSVSKVQLQSIAQNGGGIYYDANNGESLATSLKAIQNLEKPIIREQQIVAMSGEETEGGNDFKTAKTIYSAFIRDNVVKNFGTYDTDYRLKNHLAPGQYAYFEFNTCTDNYAVEDLKSNPTLKMNLTIFGDRMGVNYNSQTNSFEESDKHNFRMEFFDERGFPFGTPIEIRDASMLKNQIYSTGIPAAIGYSEGRENYSCEYFMRIGSDDFAISKYDTFEVILSDDTTGSFVSNTEKNNTQSSEKDSTNTEANKKETSLKGDNKILYIALGSVSLILVIVVVFLIVILQKKKTTVINTSTDNTIPPPTSLPPKKPASQI